METPFLYGDIEEEVYMHCPEGMVNTKEDEEITAQIYHLRPRLECQAVLQKVHKYSQRYLIFGRYSRSLPI